MKQFNVQVTYMKSTKLPVFVTTVEATTAQAAESMAKQFAKTQGFAGAVKKVVVKEIK
jgi:hypothetical protein